MFEAFFHNRHKTSGLPNRNCVTCMREEADYFKTQSERDFNARMQFSIENSDLRQQLQRTTREFRLFQLSQPPRKDPMATTIPAAAPANSGIGEWWWHLHHEVLAEKTTEPIQNRIDYIKQAKPKAEQAMRLHLLRRAYIPENTLTDEQEAANEAIALAQENLHDEGLDAAAEALDAFIVEGSSAPSQAVLEQLHKDQCFPNCPWNGKTIFPNGVR